jgi:hypothetical protein
MQYCNHNLKLYNTLRKKIHTKGLASEVLERIIESLFFHRIDQNKFDLKKP